MSFYYCEGALRRNLLHMFYEGVLFEGLNSVGKKYRTVSYGWKVFKSFSSILPNDISNTLKTTEFHNLLDVNRSTKNRLSSKHLHR